MAICYDKERKTYYIKYTITLPTGEVKSRKIRNKERTKKRVLQQIENDIITKDKEQILKDYHKEDGSFQYLIDTTFAQMALSKKESTIYGYELVYKNYIKPFINNSLPIDKILEPVAMLNLISKIRETCKKKKVTANRLNLAIQFLKEVYDQAFALDLIGANTYSKGKLLLKRDKVETVSDDKLMFWTPEQFDIFIKTFESEDTKWKMFFEIAYWGGFRIGEILGLKWKDFDYDKKTLNVNKTLDTKGRISTTKNKASIGDVYLPNEIADELLLFKNAFVRTYDTDFIFFRRKTSRTSVRRIMDKHIKLGNLPHIKFHSLRHSIASRMINAGALPIFVSKHLRHASTQQTLDTYSHLFPQVNEGLMDRIFNQSPVSPQSSPQK